MLIAQEQTATKRPTGKTEFFLGRPTKFNRDDAVEIAMNTFWTKGYEPTSVSDLATAMNITRSSFYNSFQDRECVFAEALVRYNSNDTDAPLEGKIAGITAAEALHLFFEGVCRKLANDPLGRGCLIINCYIQASPDKPAPPGVHEFMETKLRQFSDCVENAKIEGTLGASADTLTLANNLLVYLMGLNVISKTIREEKTLKAMAGQFLENAGFNKPQC
jgi:TetR/AcrR family transcriptional repressor of nem operon